VPLRANCLGLTRVAGSCTTLAKLVLAGERVATLDLRGCAQLLQLDLKCPSLSALDASFCGQLAGPALLRALRNGPPLTRLALSVCLQVRQEGEQTATLHSNNNCLTHPTPPPLPSSPLHRCAAWLLGSAGAQLPAGAAVPRPELHRHLRPGAAL
jgi:hypothetical protein